MFDTYASDERFTVSEKIELLVNIIASLVPDLPTYLLQIIIVDLQRQPLWMDIVLPKGRTLHSCQIVFEEMRRSMPSGTSRPYPPPTSYVTIAPAIAPISDPLLPTRRPLQPRPSVRATESPHPPVTNGELPIYTRGTLLDPPEQSKKRSRPTKAEVAERDEAYAERGQTYQPKKSASKRIRPSLGADTLSLRDEDITIPFLRTPEARITSPIEETSGGKRRSRRQPQIISPILIPSAGAYVSKPELEQKSEVNIVESPSDRILAGYRDRYNPESSLNERKILSRGSDTDLQEIGKNFRLNPSKDMHKEPSQRRPPTPAAENNISSPSMQPAHHHPLSWHSASSDARSKDKSGPQTEDPGTDLTSVFTDRDKLPAHSLSHRDEPESGIEQLHRGFDGTEAVYSANACTEILRKGDFVQYFVQLLGRDLSASQWDAADLCLSGEIEGILSEYAARLRHEDTVPELRQVARFIDEHGSLIGTAFQKAIFTASDDEAQDSRPLRGKTALGGSLQLEKGEPVDTAAAIGDTEQLISQAIGLPLREPAKLQEFDKLERLFAEAPSYKWLLSVLCNKSYLRNTLTDTHCKIRQEILKVIPKPTIVRHDVLPPLIHATFAMELKLDLGEDELTSDRIGCRVTVTGSELEAQAMTSEDYVQQMWPTTGSSVLQLFQDALTNGFSTLNHLSGTSLAASYQSPNMRIEVTGIRETIAELAEQLCWICAALNLGPDLERVLCCLPSIQHLEEIPEIAEDGTKDFIEARSHFHAYPSRRRGPHHAHSKFKANPHMFKLLIKPDDVSEDLENDVPGATLSGPDDAGPSDFQPPIVFSSSQDAESVSNDTTTLNTTDTAACELCNRNDVTTYFCSPCTNNFCDECWPTLIQHRPMKNSLDGRPHIKESRRGTRESNTTTGFICSFELKSGIPGSNNHGCGKRFKTLSALKSHWRGSAGQVCIKPLLGEGGRERRLHEQMRKREPKSANLPLPHPFYDHKQIPELQRSISQKNNANTPRSALDPKYTTLKDYGTSPVTVGKGSAAETPDQDFKDAKTPIVHKQNMRAHFRIKLEYKKAQEPEGSGTCWHKLFKHCILVQGYPIRRRPEESLGLEVPLNLLARLVGTRYLHEFAGSTFLKGFSTCLSISKTIKDVVVWHTRHKNAAEHISYLESDLSHLSRRGVEEVAGLRHIVGWCTKIRNYCGVVEGKYDVQSSILPVIGQHGALYDCRLSFGKPIAGPMEFNFSANYQPIVSSVTGYLDMFKFLERRFVLLWDSQDHRGWLVNGLRALLHLLRQSLRIDEEKDGGELFVLRSGDFDEPLHPYDKNAAWRFLSNQKNLSVRIALSTINHSRQEYEVLGDRVQQFYDVIEKSFDYQRKPPRYWGAVPRSQLEGWDFVSLARKDNPIEPSVLTLPSVGRSWVDFLRATNIVTLFGNGFGEILRPGLETCTTVPCGKFYMAVTVSDIRELMIMNRCDYTKIPRSICKIPPILWYSPVGSCSPCGCLAGPRSQQITRDVQVMWPTCFLNHLPVSTQFLNIEKNIDGAVIFGHSDTLHHFVSDIGPPTPGIPPHPLQELELLEDSAIGSSPDTKDETLTRTSTKQSFNDSARAASSNPESPPQVYGNSEISGTAVLGTIGGNYIVNQYYAYSVNQSVGERVVRPPTQGFVSLNGSNFDQPTHTMNTTRLTQHHIDSHTIGKFDDIMNEMQQGEDEIKEMKLEKYCQVLRF